MGGVYGMKDVEEEWRLLTGMLGLVRGAAATYFILLSSGTH